jgi:hypothetical protein
MESVCDDEHLGCSLESFATTEFNKIIKPFSADIRILIMKTETVSETSADSIHLILTSAHDYSVALKGIP